MEKTQPLCACRCEAHSHERKKEYSSVGIFLFLMIVVALFYTHEVVKTEVCWSVDTPCANIC